MLQVRMPLLSTETTDRIAQEEFPVASAEISVHRNQGYVKITLTGVVLGESVDTLLQFLKDVSSFGATTWILEMKDLSVISARGLQVLVRLSKVLARRGMGLRVESIHKNVYATMQELNLTRYFIWPD